MHPRGEQAGYGLVEALVSVLLTSVVILALAGSLLTAIKSSAVADRVQRADSAIGSFTESLKSMPYPTTMPAGECPDLQDYRDAWAGYGDAWPGADGVTLEITGIEHWQTGGGDAGSYGAACDGGDPLAHRLTVEVTIEDRSRSAQVVVTGR